MGIRLSPSGARKTTCGLRLDERLQCYIDNARYLCSAGKLSCFCEKLIVN